jgi:hypothetical protein
LARQLLFISDSQVFTSPYRKTNAVGEHDWTRVHRAYDQSAQAWSELGPASAGPTLAGLHPRPAKTTTREAREERARRFIERSQ